jgi:hypothetical protein
MHRVRPSSLHVYHKPYRRLVAWGMLEEVAATGA